MATLVNIPCPTCSTCFTVVSSDGTVASSDRTVVWRAGGVVDLGRFQLVEHLGAGHFGNVWKARDTELDRIVAIKIPRRDQLEVIHDGLFLREARAAAQLRHPHIVGVHEIGRHEDTVFIVSDYIDGANLREWLRSRRPTVTEAVRLCIRLAEALHHAHESGIVHRDLKPANIMVSLDGEPHIMDFGLAKRDAGEATVTLDGQILGTPAYMPPEQARGEGHQVDCRADIYSLGVILFQLLTGELPFAGDKRMLIVHILQSPPPGPRTLNDRISRDLETVCLKCLEKNPNDRYATAAELASDLTCVLEGRPTTARPLTATQRMWRWFGMPSRLQEFATLAVGVGILGYIVILAGAIPMAFGHGPVTPTLSAALHLLAFALFLWTPWFAGGLAISHAPPPRKRQVLFPLITLEFVVGACVIVPAYALGYQFGGLYVINDMTRFFFSLCVLLNSAMYLHGLMIWLAGREDLAAH
ncbi:MAG: serine/threonine-protein kinase [Maioricimonas sp. JB049]